MTLARKPVRSPLFRRETWQSPITIHIYILLGNAIFAVFIGILSNSIFDPNGELSNFDVIMTFVVLFLGVIASETVHLHILLFDADQRNSRIEQIVSNSDKQNNSIDKYNQILSRLHASDPLINWTGTTAFNTFVSQFKISLENTLRFIGEQTSIKAFEILWRHLISLQIDREDDNPIIVYAIHVVTARIWNQRTSNRLMEYQETFTENGGIIFRIFIGEHTSNINPKYYSDAMTRMDAMKNVHTCFLKRDYGTHGSGYKDFLVTNDENICYRWDIDEFDRRILGTEIRIVDKDDDYLRNLKDTWKELLDHVSEVNYNLDYIESDSTDQDYFRESIEEIVRISKKFQNTANQFDTKARPSTTLTQTSLT